MKKLRKPAPRKKRTELEKLKDECENNELRISELEEKIKKIKEGRLDIPKQW